MVSLWEAKAFSMLLGNLKDLARSLEDRFWEWANGDVFIIGELYCPRCGGTRRVKAQMVHCRSEELRPAGPPLPPHITSQFASPPPLDPRVLDALTPSLFALACVQCDAQFTLLIYAGSTGPSLALLPTVEGGLATPNTPAGVRYYLDQAAKSHSVGANSAAVAMFRAALEFLLMDQGYKERMLGPKLQALEKGIADGTAPKWTLDLDTAFLKVIKDLGNASIHAEDPDVSKQSQLDTDLYMRVAQTFQELVDLIYEDPLRKAKRLSALQATAASLKE